MQEWLRFESSGEEVTASFAARLAHCCKVGDCITLQGDLGAGKTAFARGFIRALAGDVEVTSPTFTLTQSYSGRTAQGEPVTLWHMDLYRIEDPCELAELGLQDALADAITLIEWPKIAESQLPQERFAVQIHHGNQENHRILVVSGMVSCYTRRNLSVAMGIPKPTPKE